MCGAHGHSSRQARLSSDLSPAAQAQRCGGEALGLLHRESIGTAPSWYSAALEQNKVSYKVVSSFHHREESALINVFVCGLGWLWTTGIALHRNIPNQSLLSIFADSAAMAKPLP